MKILVILGHPDRGSFNHALADAVCEELRALEHRVVFHDLCAERFAPHLPADEIPENAKLPPLLRRHCRELRAADGIVIVHPNWWGQPPAVLKGWIDRVFRPGVAYRFKEGDTGEGVPVGLLRARAALVLNTSNTPDRRERQVFGDPLERLWKDCVFGLCGVRRVCRRTFNVVVASTATDRRRWLAEAKKLARKQFPRDKRSRCREKTA
jgi:NAD(P)H dehydrogenase (quinone)